MKTPDELRQQYAEFSTERLRSLASESGLRPEAIQIAKAELARRKAEGEAPVKRKRGRAASTYEFQWRASLAAPVRWISARLPTLDASSGVLVFLVLAPAVLLASVFRAITPMASAVVCATVVLLVLRYFRGRPFRTSTILGVSWAVIAVALAAHVAR